jgi:hypothetical protein
VRKKGDETISGNEVLRFRKKPEWEVALGIALSGTYYKAFLVVREYDGESCKE